VRPLRDSLDPVRRPLVLLLAAVPLLVAGCGDANPADPGVTPASESMPACGDVWVEGQTLPKDYQGCTDDKGVLQVSEIKKCTSADGEFTTYGDGFFAMLGEKISQGTASETYQQAYATCFGTDW